MHQSDAQEVELAQIAGVMVHFVCLDVGPSSSEDFEFDARCQFIPRIGDRIEYKRLNMEVTKVLHNLVDGSPKGLGFCAIPTVVCRFLRANDEETDREVARLIQSLSGSDNIG